MNNLIDLLNLDTFFSALVSILVALLGPMCFYFGKIITSVRVEQYDKWDVYIEGVLFVLIYILLTTLLTALLMENFSLISDAKILLLISIFLFLIITIFIAWITRNEIARSLKRRKRAIATKINMILLFPSFAIAIIIDIAIFRIENIISSILLLIFSLFAFTLIAIAYGYGGAYYPYVKIHIRSKKMPLKGRILKYGDFIILSKDDNNRILINKSSIDYIEEEMHEKIDHVN